jgi:hypothetical protein
MLTRPASLRLPGAAAVHVDGLFDPVSLLRTLSESDIAKRGEADAESPSGATSTSSATAGAAVAPTPQEFRPFMDAASATAERAIMTPNVYGAQQPPGSTLPL